MSRSAVPPCRHPVRLLLAVALASLLAVLPGPPAAAGVGLGTATSFAVLSGAGITNTGPTTINGDVGTFPTTTRSGFDSVTLVGTDHGGDSVTQGAKDDLVTAYDEAAGRSPATPHAVELGGQTLLPGVYTSETFGLTGTLTLDAQGVEGAEFVFQAGSTLIAEANSRVLLVNGASPCDVVWQVGTSATFKTGTDFAGDVLAYASITAQTRATFAGRLLARDGAVTLDTNTISNAACYTAPTPTASPTPSASGTVPPPTSAAPSVAATTAGTAGTGSTSGPGGTTGGRGAGGTAAGVPVGAAGGPGTARGTGRAPSLPATGQRLGLSLTGLLVLAFGGLLVVLAGRVRAPGRHRLGH